MTRKAQLKPRKQKGERKREDNMFKRHKSKRQIVRRRSSLAKKQRCEGCTSATTRCEGCTSATTPSSVAAAETDPKLCQEEVLQIVPRRSSPAEKQRCEGSTSATTPTSSVAAAETDPRSIIKSYEYDPVDEKEYKPVGRFGQHMARPTKKVLREYLRQIEESDGFDVMHFPKTFFGFGTIMPILDLRESADTLKSLAELALGQYNEEKQGSKLEFVKIVKANTVACAGRRYFITFDAKDASAGDGCTSTYEAEVWVRWSQTIVQRMRPKKQGD